MQAIRAIDMFCGAGGSSWGARLAGVQIVAGFDMWDLACKVYKDNFPEAQVYPCELEQLDLEDVERALGNIDLILASPECTNHSSAKGGLPRCEKSKETALQVARFAEVFGPRWIVVENVLSMRKWSRYEEFLDGLRDLGYGIRKQVLNAADFGVPQKRSRLFIICDREKEPSPVKGSRKTHRTAASIVDQDGTYPYSRLRTQRRAQPTLERADRAIRALGAKEPFLIVYYGSDGAGGWQRMDVPLRTITTLDRFALVKPTDSGRVMRMLQPPELKGAMGMPKRFRIEHGSRRDRIKLIGNAVCPPVMRSVVKTLTKPR